MSGHSKWHNIQKTKGAQDAKRAAAFTKISKEMIVAVQNADQSIRRKKAPWRESPENSLFIILFSQNQSMTG